MLSRRNIRIKVMQVLYAKSRDKQLTFPEALKAYRNGIRQSYELYLFNLMQFMKVIEYSFEDARLKEGKLRPTVADKMFIPKLRENSLSDSFFDDESLIQTLSAYKIDDRISSDNIRSFYHDFSKTDAYKAYLGNENCTDDDHREMLLELFKFLINNELFNETIEDNFLSWTDDKSLAVGAMKKTLKALPVEPEFFRAYKPTEETTREFGEVLLEKVEKEDKLLLAIIEPSLKNWDAERVAVIDMILLKMAICELTSFETVPTKVTLNEFVEISKQYSTDKSKDFINGILDRLMKKLEKEGKIKKAGRGLIE